jgi:peptidoglycan/LPS O-acetylase OafA/YrhL
LGDNAKSKKINLFKNSDGRGFIRMDIQMLRGIAVIAVVLFHSFETFFTNGFLGVDVFFVISGYVVTPLIIKIFNHKEGAHLFENLRFFWIRRFQRLAPALASTLIISTLVILLFGDPSNHLKFTQQGIATLLLLGNLGAYFFAGDYFAPTPNPLIHTWSLSVEAQVYLSLPLVLMTFYWFTKIVKKNFFKRLIGFFLSLTFISFFLFITDLSQLIFDKLNINLTSNFFYYFTPVRLWEFTVGSVAFLLGNGKSQKFLNQYFALLLRCVLLILLLTPHNLSAKVAIILICTTTVTLIYFQSFQFNVGSRLLVWCGDRSYSIYLVHLPVFYIAEYFSVFLLSPKKYGLVFQSAILLLVLILANLQYRFIEKRYWAADKGIEFKFKLFLRLFSKYVVLPFVILSIVATGSQNRYWGLDRNVTQPSAGWERDFGCNQISKDPRICVFEDFQNVQRVLLIGDSHAYQYTESFLSILRANNLNGAISTQGGCLLQVDVDLVKDPTQSVCLSNNRVLLEWIESYEPSAIIVSQFIHSYSSQRHVREYLSLLRTISPNILIIENNPIFPDAEVFMKPRPLILTTHMPAKVFQVSKMISTDEDASNNLALWARDNGISTLNVDSIFCGVSICRRFLNSQWLYWDDDHLSGYGASLVAPKILEYLNQSIF